MSINEKDFLELKIRMLELENKLKDRDAEIGVKDRELLRLKEVLDEPDPTVGRSGRISMQKEKTTEELLSELTPAELMILAKKHGITLAQIFPV
jgi:hypothetical protein